MLKTHFLAGGAAMVLMASAAVALAIPQSFYVHRANPNEIAASLGGQGSLNRAVSAVEELTHGRVLEIHFENGSGAGHYNATVSRNGVMEHALVNLSAGQVAIVDQAQEPTRTFDFKKKSDAEVIVVGAKVALSDAIANAEQSSRGVAVSARTTRSGDGYMVAHDIETVKADMVHPVLVDAKTGMVIQNAQAFGSQP